MSKLREKNNKNQEDIFYNEFITKLNQDSLKDIQSLYLVIQKLPEKHRLPLINNPEGTIKMIEPHNNNNNNSLTSYNQELQILLDKHDTEEKREQLIAQSLIWACFMMKEPDKVERIPPIDDYIQSILVPFLQIQKNGKIS